MQLFYIPSISETFSIEGEEVKHISKVLRKNIGDIIQVTDGLGKGYDASIIAIEKNEIICRLGVVIENNIEISTKVHLAVAPTKNIDRYEWLVEKAVELGVSEITPILAKHSERKNINLERLQKIAVSAMKQSGRFILPQINELTKLSDFQSNSAATYFAHCREGQKENFAQMPLPSSLTILVGPEGDFSLQEIEEFEKKKYIPIELGDTRLRTETAAMYAMAIVKAS